MCSLPRTDTDYLKSIDKTLKEILKEIKGHRKKPPTDLTAKVDGEEIAKQVSEQIEKEYKAYGYEDLKKERDLYKETLLKSER